MKDKDIAKMLEGVMASVEENDGPSIEQLQDYARMLTEKPHPFRAGDVIEHKFGEHGPSKTATVQGVFVRYIEKPIRSYERASGDDLFNMSSTYTLDAIAIYPLGGDAVQFLIDTTQHRLAKSGHDA